jgi:hypothetical protein
MRRSLFPLAVLFSGVLITAPAYADLVQTASSEDVLNGRVSVEVWAEGGGLNLDFSEAKQKITRIILDDPSQIVYSHCLLSKDCPPEGEPVIHLKRIKRINFPNIPKTTATSLTVVTRDKSGKYHTFVFPLKLGSGKARYNKLVIRKRGLQSMPVGQLARDSNVESLTIAQLQRGIARAKKRRNLVDPQMKRRINSFLGELRAGEDLETAAQKAGVSLRTVEWLAKMGGKAPIVSRAASKILPVPVESLPLETESLTAKRLPPPPEVASISHKLDTASNLDVPSAQKVATTTASLSDPGEEQKAEVPSKSVSSAQLANRLQVGLAIAGRKKKISNGSSLWYQVNTAIRTLRSGATLEKAAQKSGVPSTKISELVKLGGG